MQPLVLALLLGWTLLTPESGTSTTKLDDQCDWYRLKPHQCATFLALKQRLNELQLADRKSLTAEEARLLWPRDLLLRPFAAAGDRYPTKQGIDLLSRYTKPSSTQTDDRDGAVCYAYEVGRTELCTHDRRRSRDLSTLPCSFEHRACTRHVRQNSRFPWICACIQP